MARKTPIETTGRFYELTNPNSCCIVCQRHKFVIVQKLTGFYAMHTYTAIPHSASYCLHAWRTRDEDPLCLRGFTPTDKQVTKTISLGALRTELKNHTKAPDLAPDRLEHARIEIGNDIPRPRVINARRFRNVIGEPLGVE